MFEALIIFAIALATCFLSLPTIMNIMRKKGIVGEDIHKKDRPSIPEMGGIAFIVGIAVSSTLGSYLFPEKRELFLSFLSTVLIAGLIGAYDDLKPLNAKVKPFLTAFARAGTP